MTTDPIRLFTAELDAAGHGARERTLLPKFAPAEQARYAAFGAERRRISWLGGRALLLAALERTRGPADAQALMTLPEGGVRYAAADLHLNLSHAGGWLAAALAPFPVGVDVEEPRQRAVVDEAARVFSPGEADALDTLSGAERQAAFYRLWTLKEAACKAAGLSVWDGLRHARFDLAAGRAELDGPFPAGEWGFLQGEPAPGVPLALAWRGGAAEVEHLHLEDGAWRAVPLKGALPIRGGALS